MDKYILQSLNKGLNYVNQDTLLAEGYISDCSNVEIIEDVISKKSSLHLFKSLAGWHRIQRIIIYTKLDGTYYILCVSQYGVESEEGIHEVIYDITGQFYEFINKELMESVPIPFKPSPHHSYTIMKDTLIFTNGIEPLYKWNGTGKVVEVANTSNYRANYICSFKNQLHLFNTIEDGYNCYQRHRYSDIGDFEKWSGGNAGFVDLQETEEPITNVGILPDMMVIFKPNSIINATWIGSPSLYHYRTAISGEGLPFRGTLCSHLNTLFFVGNENIYQYTGGENLIPIGDNIKSQIFPIDFEDNAKGFIDVRKNCYIVVCKNSAFSYDIKNQVWTKYNLSIVNGCGFTTGMAKTIEELEGTIEEQNWTLDAKPVGIPQTLVVTENKVYNLYGSVYTDEAFFDTLNIVKFDSDNFISWNKIYFNGKSFEDGIIEVFYKTESDSDWVKIGEDIKLSKDYQIYSIDFRITSKTIKFRFKSKEKYFEIKPPIIIEYFERTDKENVTNIS